MNEKMSLGKKLIAIGGGGFAVCCIILLSRVGNPAPGQSRYERLQVEWQAAETAACAKAGMSTPTWLPCGGGGLLFSGSDCFHCADTTGRIFPVVAPPCNKYDVGGCPSN